MVKVGVIGIGFMGMTHYTALKRIGGGKVTAICTRDPKKLAGDWSSIQGNFGGSGGIQDLSRVARYTDISEMLADDSIDMVDICLPTHLHREVSIAALRAGKHVLVEKPLALNLADCDAMLRAANKADRLLMVGHVLRFFPAFAEAHALVTDGKYGALLGAHLKRVISRPTWAQDTAIDDLWRSGGPAIDLHIHDTDFVHYLAGVPQRVQSSGYTAPSGAILSINTQYLYDGANLVISAQSGALSMPGIPFEHGYDIYLERATVRYNSLFTGDEVRLSTADGKNKSYRPRRKDAFVAQLQHAVDCVRQGHTSPLIDATQARSALATCLRESESVRSGKPVRVRG